VYRFAAGHYSNTPVTTTMLAQQSLAVDSAGTLYSVYNQNTLYKYVRSTTSPAYSFASTADGTSSSDSPQTVTLENDGNAPLIFAAPTNGNNPSISTGFTIGGTFTCPLLTPGSGTGTLASGSTCSEPVSFSPLAIGSYTGSLVFTDNTLNVAGSTQTTALSGTATIGNKTITFTPVTYVYAGTGTTLVATTSSGEPVTFSVTNGTGTATLNGSTISYLTPGTVTVTANSAATANYNTAPPVSVTVTILIQPMIFLAGSGKVASLGDTGAVSSAAVSGGGLGVAVDASGTVWSLNSGGGGFTSFTTAGALGTGYSTLLTNGASALAIDGNSHLVIPSGSGATVTFSNAGALVSTTQGSATAAPSGVAIDLSGNVWVTNAAANSVDEIIGGAAPAAPLATAVQSATPGAKP